jgi:hypothetical protein
MKRRGPWLVGLLVVMAAAVALGNVPPTMEDQYVTTVEGTPVVFELRAQDADIDPNDPDGHPLRFVLVEGPSHGVLIGDMGEVMYEGPHDAVIELTYVPAKGFVGTDVVTVTVYDPYDETATGTVTIEIDVTERRVVELLSGNWTMNTTIVPQSGTFTAFGTQLTEVYRIGPLTVKGIAGWGMTSVGGVEKVRLNALRLEGDVKLSGMTASTTLAFDPDAATALELFDYWRSTVGFALQGVSFRHTFYLEGDVTSSYQSLYAEACVGDVNVTNTARLDVNEACDFEFGRNDTAVSWSWCDLDLLARLSVTCVGFGKASINLYELPILEDLPGLTLDVGLTFTVEEKRLVTTWRWRPEAMGCLRLYGEVEVGGEEGMKLEGLSIYGLKLETEIAGVRVVSASSFDPQKNSMVTGKTDYFEVVRATGTLTGCCGAEGSWGMATYFQSGSDQLFDWGMTTGRFNLTLNDHVDVDFELVNRSGGLGDPAVELSFGWTVRW